SFAKKNSLETIQEYFATHSKDFIQFKASLLAEDVKNNPSQRAEVIREVVESIAKIPDLIKQEVYLQDTAKVLNISEQVLFNTLAQIQKSNQRKSNRAVRQSQKLQVVEKEPESVQKVDAQRILEKQILEILLLYGDKEEVFEEVFEVLNEKGEIKMGREQVESTVHRKIYLELQEDEIEFTDPI